MSWQLDWTYVAEHRDLHRIHWRVAGDLIAELMRFAETGRGARPVKGERLLKEIRVSGAVAIVALNPIERVVIVLRLYRA